LIPKSLLGAAKPKKLMSKKPKNLEYITVGITGNPNVGKSTLFNTLTGAHQHVGNWPGKTVEKKEGYFVYKNHKIQLVDLPGTYGLAAYTEEEAVTREFILNEQPDIIIQIIDAENLERNLYLTLQLLELGQPIILALNMFHSAEKHGVYIDEKKLSKLLGVPVVKIEAPKKKELGGLPEKILSEAHKPWPEKKFKLTYGPEVSEEIRKIKEFLSAHKLNLPGTSIKNIHWIILRLLQNDERLFKKIRDKKYFDELKNLLERSQKHLIAVYGKDIEEILTEVRYNFIRGLSQEVIKRKKEAKAFSDKIDKIITHKYLGLIIFLFIIFFIFQATFNLAAPLAEIINNFFAWGGEKLSAYSEIWRFSPWVGSLINNGIIGGVGTILSFIPNIFLLFLFIGIMEDTGYLARVAYVMDRFMHRIGLHGKSFIPLILGFGCNVPAIMATRILRSKKDRILTILIIPLMSCSGRLPIYVLFTAAFFSAYQGWIIFSLYLLGIILAIIIGLIFKRLFFGQLSEPFVIELPPYRFPVLKGLFIHAWEKTWIFIKKAGTIILLFSLIIWLLASFPLGTEYASAGSIIGKIGSLISPIFKPLGFGQWEPTVALIFGTVAKEVVVGTLGTLYGASQGLLGNILKQHFNSLSAFSFMVFSLIYLPCLATMAVIKKETNSWKWMLFAATYSIVLAWIVSFIVFQGGKLLSFT